MLQYSVYEIDNSEHILNNIITDINSTWLKQFDENDSVYIFKLSSSCTVERFGYAHHDEEDLIIIT